MARRKKNRVKFARVPTGVDTCGFCIMLASRGAVYSSAEAAGELNHYHANCHCRVVPSWNGSSIDGYDDMEYYRIYKQAVKDAGLDPKRLAWHESDENVKKIVAAIEKRLLGKEEKKTFAAFSNKQIIKLRSEISTYPETGYFYDSKGNVIGDLIVGTENTIPIDLPNGYKFEDLGFSHTHNGKFGGTFSVYAVNNGEIEGDIYAFTQSGMFEMRAEAKEATYIIAKTGASKPSEFFAASKAYFDDIYGRFLGNELDDFYEKNKRAPYQEDMPKIKERLHKKLSIELDKWFSANAKEYGYVYMKEVVK